MLGVAVGDVRWFSAAAVFAEYSVGILRINGLYCSKDAFSGCAADPLQTVTATLPGS